MEILEKQPVPVTNFCEWCCAVGTSRCGRCHIVYYCSREHQIQHWSVHKKVCKKAPPPEINLSINSSLPGTSQGTCSAYQGWSPSCVLPQNNTNEIPIQTIVPAAVVCNPSSCDVNSQKVIDFHMREDEIFSSLSSELLSSDNNFWDLINSCDTQNISEYMYLDKDTASQTVSGQVYALHSQTNENSCVTNEDIRMECASLNDICANIIHDMNAFGICVLDNFIGSNYGNLIVQEVKNLYLTGIFKKGEIVNPNQYRSKENIRCDVTTWVDGTEPNCKYIGNLMKKLDVVVTTCNKMPNNGEFSKYKLHRRTKAMIACYPADGTYYKKHIDNPHKDGRCITCIYYLNQNWDTKIQGGLLRMFPINDDSQVANVEPIFDRMIFFWSDKRNPHEVLPSFDTRFALTIWYFDADERDQALAKSRERASMHRSQAFAN